MSPAAARGLTLFELLGLDDHTDETGRLLLEDSAPPQAQRRAAQAGVAMTTAQCPFADTPSRHGGLMNQSAYEALRADTGAILDGFAWLAEHYYALAPAHRHTAQGLVDLAQLATTLPLPLFHRAHDPVPAHGALPSFVASVFKAARGVHSAAFDLAEQRGPDAALGDGAAMVAFVEERGHLRRADTGRVCAAPTRLLRRTLDVLVTGEGAHGERSQLAAIASFATLWKFHQLEQGFSRGLRRYRGVLDQATVAAGGRGDAAALFRCQLNFNGRLRSFGELTDEFLEFANAVQGDLNQVLDRSRDAPALDFDAILRTL